MGIEYLIRVELPAEVDPKAILCRLENPKDENGWEAFTASVVSNGYYFCDNCWSAESTIAFRALVDHSLLYSGSVIVEQS